MKTILPLCLAFASLAGLNGTAISAESRLTHQKWEIDGLDGQVTHRVRPLGPSTTVFIHASSDSLDPALRVEDSAGALLSKDDNSGGGKTAFIQIQLESRARLRIILSSRGRDGSGQVTIRLIESHETQQSLNIENNQGRRLDEVNRLLDANRVPEAIVLLESVVRPFLNQGKVESPRVSWLLWNAGFLAHRTNRADLAKECWTRSVEFRRTVLPETHPALQTARANLADTLKNLGYPKEAEAIEERILEVFSRTLADDHADHQRARLAFASTLGLLGKLERGIALQRKVIEVYSRTLPKNDPNLLWARSQLAVSLRLSGDLEDARVIEEDVLAIVSAEHSDGHLGLRSARRNLASTLHELGNFQRAGELREKVLKVAGLTLNEDHLDLQRARIDLATTLNELGDLRRAKELQQAAIEVYTRTLPEDHHVIHRAKHNLADTLFALEDFEGATELQESVFEFFSRTTPKDHPDLIRAQENLARFLHEVGELIRAKFLAEQVEEVYARSFADDDPKLQRIRGDLAMTLHSLGELLAAAELRKRILRIYLQAQHPDHPDIQRARSNLAMTLSSLGDLRGAESLQRQVIDSYSRRSPNVPRELWIAEGNLANTLFALGDTGGAKELQQRIVAEYSRTFPPEHPDVLLARSNLATTLRALGDYRQARIHYEKVLEIISRTHPEGHPTLLSARYNLAVALYNGGNLEVAADIQESVLESSIRLFPTDHPKIQSSRSQYALILLELGDRKGAKRLQEKVLEVYSRTLPKDHPNLQSARSNLALTLERFGEFERARRLHQQAFDVSLRNLPKDSPGLLSARNNFASVLARQGDTEALTALIGPQLDSAILRLLRFEIQLSPRQCSALSSESNRTASRVFSLLLIASSLNEVPADLKEKLFSLVETLRSSTEISTRLTTLESRAEPEDRSKILAHRREIAVESANIVKFSQQNVSTEIFQGALERKENAQLKLRRILSRLPGAKDLLSPASVKLVADRIPEGSAAVRYWKYTRFSLDPEDPSEQFTGVPAYLGFIVKKDGTLQLVDLGPAQKIETAAIRWREAIGSPLDDRAGSMSNNDPPGDEGLERRSGERLRELILDPILTMAGDTSELFVAAAGAIHVVPLDSLPAGDSVVGDRLTIRLAPSLRGTKVETKPVAADDTLLVLGGVDYRKTPTRYTPKRAEGRPANPEKSGTARRNRSGAPIDLTRTPSWKRGFKYLRGSRSEAKLVAEWFKKGFPDAPPPWTPRGTDASRATLLDYAPQSRFLHIATHGWFAPTSIASQPDSTAVDAKMGFGRITSQQQRIVGFSPLVLCGLALAGANLPPDRGGEIDGFVTAEEIASLDLTRCELAVLSACETNVGLERGSQGIESLQKSLHAAGVHTAVTSLWKVPDKATAELMGDFYRRVLMDREAKPQALWNAKKKLRDKRDKSGEPVYRLRDWAAWVISGE